MISDQKLQKLYDQYLEYTDHMVSEYGPMEVAAIMMAQALSIYRSGMSDDDYNKMVDSISSNRAQVKTFSPTVFQ